MWNVRWHLWHWTLNKVISLAKEEWPVAPIVSSTKIIFFIIYGTSGWVLLKIVSQKSLNFISNMTLSLYPVICMLPVVCELLQQVDKEYSETSNYMKGHWSIFKDWQIWYHPGKQYLPVIWVLGRNRQDAAFEGSFPVYDRLDDMLAFTHKCLLAGDIVLQCSFFLSLGSMEVVAQLHVASILHLAVILPMSWLAGHTHNLVHCIWGEWSMGHAIDLLYGTFVEVQMNPELLLQGDFIMSIFLALFNQLPELKEYLDFYKEK